MPSAMKGALELTLHVGEMAWPRTWSSTSLGPLAWSLYARPGHPYTEALLSAIPIPDPRVERNKVLQLLSGDMPSPMDPPSGCVFHPRCPRAIAGVCETSEPPLAEVSPGHSMRCHIPIEELRRLQGIPLS